MQSVVTRDVIVKDTRSLFLGQVIHHRTLVVGNAVVLTFNESDDLLTRHQSGTKRVLRSAVLSRIPFDDTSTAETVGEHVCRGVVVLVLGRVRVHFVSGAQVFSRVVGADFVTFVDTFDGRSVDSAGDLGSG